MPELIIPIGIPGSGKSTYINKTYRNNCYSIICLDDIRMACGNIFNPELEPMIKGMFDIFVRSMMIREQNIIFDSTNVNINITTHWINTANNYDYDVILIIMKTDDEISIARQTKNVPDSTINRFIEQRNFLLSRIDEFDVRVIEVDDNGIII